MTISNNFYVKKYQFKDEATETASFSWENQFGKEKRYDRKNKTKIDLTYELNPEDSIIFDTGKRIYPKNLLTVLVFDLFLTSISIRSAAVDENVNT